MKDRSELSIGANTKKLLELDVLLTTAINTFSSDVDLRDEKNKLAVFLPGLVIYANTTFGNQMSLFRSNGYSIVGIDYSKEAHSQPLLKAQIVDFLSCPEIRNRKVTLIGMSLGAGTIIDTLAQQGKDGLTNVEKVVLLGTVYSNEDIKNSIFGKALSFANRLTPEMVAKRFAPLAKRIFQLDPLHEVETREEVYEITSKALIDRAKEIGKTNPIEDVNQFPNIHALIGWWEDDYASSQARERLENLFPYRDVFTIPGHHSWTRTGAEAINSAISAFQPLKG